jgi:acyl dehydratase
MSGVAGGVDVEVGGTLPPLERTIDLVSMVAYAGATWDWHRMHYDRDFVAAKGFDAPVVDGQVLGALMVEVLQDGLGPRARVRTLDFRFRSMVYAEETVRVTATRVAAEEDRGALAFDLVVDVVRTSGRNHAANERVAVTGTATVEIAGVVTDGEVAS